jgi:hypothetical protein
MVFLKRTYHNPTMRASHDYDLIVSQCPRILESVNALSNVVYFEMKIAFAEMP